MVVVLSPYVSTGTVCIFPTTTPDGITPNNTADCTITYAQRLGSTILGMQITLLIVAASTFVTESYRLYTLKRNANAIGKGLYDMLSARFHTMAVFFSFFLMLESIDLFGFMGLLPFAFYALMDEFVAASGISIALMLADFWVRVSHPEKSTTGLGRRTRLGIIAWAYLNFPGFIILGLSIPSQAAIFEGLKALSGVFLLVLLMGITVHPIRDILKILRDANTGHMEASQNNRHFATILTHKYAFYITVLVIAACALFANALLSFGVGVDGTPNYSLSLPIQEQPDPVQFALKGCFICLCVGLNILFTVNGNKSGSSSPPVNRDNVYVAHYAFFGMASTTVNNNNNADETFSIMDDGQVANSDDGATISVVQHETVDVDINDALVPNVARLALHVSQYLVHRSVGYGFAFVTSGILAALLAVALATDQIVAAIVFLIVVTLGCLALLLATLSKKVLAELWYTDFLRFRIVVTLLGTGLLTDALGGTSDARSMVAPALGMLQFIAFCTDALVTPLLRSSILWCAYNTTFITWIFIFWDLVPNIRNTIIPIGSGYSLLQASRDILLAQWTLFLVEGRFLYRGRDHKRFLHVTRPVEKLLLSNAETQSRETFGNIKALAMRQR